MTTLAPDVLPASTAVRVEGALLSADLINKIRFTDRELPGAAPADYGLPRGVRVEDAASRKWEYLKATYASFREQLAELGPDADPAKLTEREWLRVLLDELGYAGRTTVPRRDGIEVPGRKRGEYRVSHLWQSHLPVHLLRWDTDLDRSVGTMRAPQSMVQELLNVSDQHLWALLSNGRVLRVLRDSTALVGSAYVEFDLDAIFDGDQFADFQLLYAMLHASRFELTAKPEKKRRAAAATDTADADEEETEAEEGTLDEVAGATDDIELTPADCRIEWWRTFAIETGIRARDCLRNQVKAALGTLGSGFLGANPALGEALTRGGKAALDDFHHELLRLAYQLVFLFVAEDRDALLLHPAADASDKEIEALEQARDLYTRYFSTARLRRIASRRAGDHNTDLWAGLRTVLDALGQEGGLEALALPELGGLYFRFDDDEARWAALLPGSPEPLRAADLPNENLLGAIRLLSRVYDRQGRPSRVDYRHLGADELGSVYESLLELIPRHNPAKEEFWLQDLVAGNKRKTTGSYYTPAVLIEKLLDNALDPVIDQHAAAGIPDRLLDIRFVDPSCGSGHVLVAAARRIALRYARMRDNELEPAPERIREAMSKVVRHCVHGVDINPLAAEIAKVSLWLESLTPGQPLAYLDDRIKVGNALLGTTPLLLESGIPETAFKKLEGDEHKAVKEARERNRKELKGVKVWTQTRLGEPATHTGTATVRVAAEEAARRPVGKGLAAIRELAKRHREFERDPELKRLKRVADAWCAAFIWPKRADAPAPITTGTLAKLEQGLRLEGIPKPEPKMGEEPVEETDEEVEWRERAGERELRDIVSRNRFFHWHLEFPRVFRVEDDEAGDANPATGWQGGFDAVLGNPPWERVELQEKEWFAARDDEIADAASAQRKSLIARLRVSTDEHGNPIEADRELYRGFLTAHREAKGTVAMLRDSGLFPLTGTGRVNLYAVFAERSRMLLAPEGITGLVLPTGIATDKTTSVFFADLVERQQLATILDLENEEKLFADVHNQYRFCLFTMGGAEREYERVRLAFRARRPDQLDAREFTLDAEGFRKINPNTCTSPVCEGPRYLAVLQEIHEQVPVLWNKRSSSAMPWGELRYSQMVNMSSDAKLFRDIDTLTSDGWALQGNVFVKGDQRYLPLYEGKFAHHFDSRFATFEDATQAQINKGTLPRLDAAAHQDPWAVPRPRHWIPEAEVEERFAAERDKPETEWPHDWLLGWRDVCRASDQRTVIASVLPRTAVGHKFPLVFPAHVPDLLLANLSAHVLDFAAKQKHAGASLAYFTFEQLPVLPPDEYAKSVPWLGDQPPESWIRSRVLELTYTSYEMAPWAEHLGDEDAPFVWDEDRRFLMRAELDAAYFHLYGIERPDLDLVMDSFRAFRNKTPTLFERTKREIIRVYEEMASGAHYRTPLDPPPGQGPRHKPGTSPLTRAVPPSPLSPATGRADQPEKAQTPARKPRNVSETDQLSGGLFGLDEIEGGDIQLDIFSSGNDT